MDASELGIGARRGELPVEPHLIDPGGIWDRCPDEMYGQFGRWLGDQAYSAVCMQLDRGNPVRALEIIDRPFRVRSTEALVIITRLLLGENNWRALRDLKGLLRGRRPDQAKTAGTPAGRPRRQLLGTAWPER
jgi:hypothetical protein